MARHRTLALGSAAPFALFALPALLAVPLCTPALADEARVLDSGGRVLSVGNWNTLRLDGGSLRIETDSVLSHELIDLDGRIISEGIVPGTLDQLTDASPALSRNPVTGDLLVVWSRESASGSRELVALDFSGEEFVGAPRVLASGATNQTDPSLIHDSRGNAYLAWRDMDWAQRIELLALDPQGEEFFRGRLSTEETVLNGAPRLGVDATGSLFVAYLGLGSGDGQPVLKVHGASDMGGGVVHVPSPIIELARVAELPVAEFVPAPSPSGWAAPSLELTVLGATPVLWWTSTDDLGREALHHAIRTGEGGWSEQSIGRITLPTIGSREQAIRRSLEMIEARYRSVISVVRTPPPGLDPGERLNLPGLTVHRR